MHHSGIYTEKKKILDQRGGWYKTNFETFVECLRKAIHDMHIQVLK